MTTADAHAADLGAILARTRYLLIDFDGPICSIYAGLPAPRVAAQLRKLFTGRQLPDDVQQTGDPIEVFAHVRQSPSACGPQAQSSSEPRRS